MFKLQKLRIVSSKYHKEIVQIMHLASSLCTSFTLPSWYKYNAQLMSFVTFWSFHNWETNHKRSSSKSRTLWRISIVVRPCVILH
jgi:hypothetical protein